MILSILKLQKLKYYAFKKSLDKGSEIQYNLFWAFFGQISVRCIKEISEIFPKMELFQMDWSGFISLLYNMDFEPSILCKYSAIPNKRAGNFQSCRAVVP